MNFMQHGCHRDGQRTLPKAAPGGAARATGDNPLIVQARLDWLAGYPMDEAFSLAAAKSLHEVAPPLSAA
jgi:hypothetical protein